ncbi:MAG: hypothetical protein WC869_08320 [Phycisphaerae bacterium]|jgi:hypothetical protein
MTENNPVIIFRPGHSGIGEVGAVFDPDGAGPEQARIEDDIAVAICMEAFNELSRRGRPCVLLGGSRRLVVAAAESFESVRVVEVHCNIGKGDYAMVFHYPGSSKGMQVAMRVAAAMTAWKCRPLSAGADWSRVQYCLQPYFEMAGDRTGDLVEVGFLDGPVDVWTDAAVARLGVALANGLMAL